MYIFFSFLPSIAYYSSQAVLAATPSTSPASPPNVSIFLSDQVLALENQLQSTSLSVQAQPTAQLAGLPQQPLPSAGSQDCA